MRSNMYTVLNLFLSPLILAQASMLTLNHDILSPLSHKNSLSLSHIINSMDPQTCAPGFYPGTDTVMYTTPYKYASVLSTIGNFSKLDYASGPPQNIKLNGSDNTVGTARFYTSPSLPSSSIVETLTLYSAPRTGPFVQVAAVNPYIVTGISPANNKPVNVTMYSNYDAMVATPVCLNGQATLLNYTTQFCATNAELGAQISRRNHMAMAQGMNVLLGNRTFTTCVTLQREGGNGTLGYPRWGGGLFMGVGNSRSGEGSMWSCVLGVILFCSWLVVKFGGVFNY